MSAPDGSVIRTLVPRPNDSHPYRRQAEEPVSSFLSGGSGMQAAARDGATWGSGGYAKGQRRLWGEGTWGAESPAPRSKWAQDQAIRTLIDALKR